MTFATPAELAAYDEIDRMPDVAESISSECVTATMAMLSRHADMLDNVTLAPLAGDADLTYLNGLDADADVDDALDGEFGETPPVELDGGAA